MKETILNIPNLLTLLRLLFTPATIVFIATKQYTLAFIFFALICATELDGTLARKFHWETKFGKIFDPLVDGIAFVTILFTLALLNKIEFSYVMLIYIFGALAFFGEYVYLKKKGHPIKTKWNTFALGLLYLFVLLVIIDFYTAILAPIILILFAISKIKFFLYIKSHKISEKIINIPNILTLIRFLMTPFIIYHLIRQDYTTALIFFIIAAVTEIDGTIARLLNQVTSFGKYLDPIVDTILILSILITLTALNRIMWPLTLCILALSIFTIFVFIKKNKLVKLKKTFFSVGVIVAIYALIASAMLNYHVEYFIIAVTGFLVLTIIDYSLKR